LKFILFVSLCLCLCACTGTHSLLMSQKINNTNSINIIFIGNSITYHSPAPDIGWHGNFGMAASAEDKDYVHIVSNNLNANYKVLDLRSWERGFWYYDYSELDKYKGWADIVIIKLGENVTEIVDFKESFMELLEHVDCKNTVVISNWWEKPIYPQVNDYMRSVTTLNNYQWVQLPEHDTSYNATNYKHKGLADHPGDKGMELIADSILTAIRNKAALSLSQNLLLPVP